MLSRQEHLRRVIANAETMLSNFPTDDDEGSLARLREQIERDVKGVREELAELENSPRLSPPA